MLLLSLPWLMVLRPSHGSVVSGLALCVGYLVIERKLLSEEVGSS